MSSLLLRGGHVLTPDHPAATSVLVVDDRVAWVGTDPTADADEVVELDGALVTPAFVDAHVHATATGLALDGLDLSSTRSLHEALDALAAYALRSPTSVLLGHGWDESSWPEGRPPSREEVDRAAGGRAAYLTRIDVHSAAVSSELLVRAPEAAGLDGYERRRAPLPRRPPRRTCCRARCRDPGSA